MPYVNCLQIYTKFYTEFFVVMSSFNRDYVVSYAERSLEYPCILYAISRFSHLNVVASLNVSFMILQSSAKYSYPIACKWRLWSVTLKVLDFYNN